MKNYVINNLVRLLLLLLGSSVAGFFKRFLGSEGSAILTTTCVSFFALVGFLFLFRIYYFSFERTTEGDSQSLLGLFRWVRGIFDTDRSHPPSESGFAPVGALSMVCCDGFVWGGSESPNRGLFSVVYVYFRHARRFGQFRA
uniref:Uncharacterized protein n=1 Tax=Brassica juncea var. tumida TaxID=323352 RepID=A0A023VXG1_BRAJU|nr:hypothetical protein [Brassica juncea var. tumida]